MTAGLDSASFRRIARAASYAFIASAGLPNCFSRRADVVMTGGQFALELGDGGVSFGQLPLDRQRLLERLQPLGRLTADALQGADVGEAARQAALKFGDGGVGLGQLPPDRQRRLVSQKRLGRLACLASG